ARIDLAVPTRDEGERHAPGLEPLRDRVDGLALRKPDIEQRRVAPEPLEQPEGFGNLRRRPQNSATVAANGVLDLQCDERVVLHDEDGESPRARAHDFLPAAHAFALPPTNSVRQAIVFSGRSR